MLASSSHISENVVKPYKSGTIDSAKALELIMDVIEDEGAYIELVDFEETRQNLVKEFLN